MRGLRRLLKTVFIPLTHDADGRHNEGGGLPKPASLNTSALRAMRSGRGGASSDAAGVGTYQRQRLHAVVLIGVAILLLVLVSLAGGRLSSGSGDEPAAGDGGGHTGEKPSSPYP